MSFLSQYRLHEIALGDDTTDKKYNDAIAAGINVFFSEKHRYQAKRSKYGDRELTVSLDEREGFLERETERKRDREKVAREREREGEKEREVRKK